MQSFSYIKISDSGEELRILGTQEMDSGGYSCTAENEAGTHQASILLEVGSKQFWHVLFLFFNVKNFSMTNVY